jgi:hypothetical protein
MRHPSDQSADLAVDDAPADADDADGTPAAKRASNVAVPVITARCLRLMDTP